SAPFAALKSASTTFALAFELDRLIASSIEIHICGQALEAAFAADPALFVPAERRRGIELVVGVRPHDAGAQFARDLEYLGSFVGPDAGREAVRRVVRFLYALLNRAEA